jgi:zona occludens toxin
MIILITGVPGAGKTLNAIKMLSEDDIFQNRPKYYHNVRGFKDSSWKEIDKDQALKWYELPDHSLVFIDECQVLFPPRPTGSKIPDTVSQMNTHRHKGFDLVLITQHPTNIDAGLRKLVGRHLHYERPFGAKRVRCLEWQRTVNDPFDDFHQRKEALVKTYPLDKKYFTMYDSAEIHTHKFRMPSKLVWVVLLLFGVVFGFVFVLSTIGDKYKPDTRESGDADIQDVAGSINNIGSTSGFIKNPFTNPMTAFIPRLHNIPASAPAYDDVYKVQSFPRLQCIYSHDSGDCQCYSQQATRLVVDYDYCLDVVKYGYFDPTKPDTARATEAGRG